MNKDIIQELSLIYVEKHATSESTPIEIADLYKKAHKEIDEYCQNNDNMLFV